MNVMNLINLIKYRNLKKRMSSSCIEKQVTERANTFDIHDLNEGRPLSCTYGRAAPQKKCKQENDRI